VTTKVRRAATADSAALTTALVTVAKQMRQVALPVESSLSVACSASPPAPRHIAALMHVVADEGLSVSTLAERLCVSLATASQIVTDLESRELVERVEDPTDRRRTLIRVCERHRDLTDVMLETRLEPVQRALDRMKPAEQRALARGLQILDEELSIQNKGTPTI
jgi:DNA-binding MarR family transcriptional regulator